MSEYPSPSFQPPSLDELAALLPAYEMMDFLAQGGMGAVYLARQISLDRLVAIKVLPPSWGAEKGYAQRFQTEARAMAKLRHNHIVGVYDFGITSDGHLYLVMEYVEGQTMHDMIRLRRLPVVKVQGIALQLCDAIQYAHEHGILHRDLKPGNVMVDKNGQVKVMDFGLARRAEAAVEEESLGTPEYTAPEILVQGALIDHRADIYALGIVFQQMLTGKVPRQPRESLSEHGHFDPGWEPLIAKAAATNAGARYQSMRELKDAVAHVNRPGPRGPAPGRPMPQGAHPAASAHRPSSPPPKSGMPVLPIVISMVVIGIGIFWWLQNKNDLVPSADSQSGGSSASSSAQGGASGGDHGTPVPAPAPAPSPAPVAPVDGAYQVPEGTPGHVLKFEEGHKDKVHSVLLLPDQFQVATASADGTIGLWNLKTGRRIRSLGPVPGMLTKVAVSADGKYLAASGDNYKAYMWKLDDLLSEPTKSLDLKARTANCIEFSADGDTLLIGTQDPAQTLVAWNWPNDRDEIIPGFRSPVVGLQIRPGDADGFLASGTRRDGEKWALELWYGHVSRKSLVKQWPDPPAPYRIRFAPDGKTLMGMAGGRFYVWDAESGTSISRQQGPQNFVYDADFSDSGRLVVAGGQDKTLNIFEAVTGALLWKSEPQATRCVNSVSVSKDGTFAVTVGGYAPNSPEKDGDYSVHVWRLPPAAGMKSDGASGAVAKREVMNLESSDPELWAMLGAFHQEWQEAAATSTETGRKDLDEKYLGALRREVTSASPSEKEYFLSEISRIANQGPTPQQRPASWPTALGRLFDIYVQQLELLPQQAQAVTAALAPAQKSKLAALEQQRIEQKNEAGAERVRLVMQTLEKLGGEPDREKILNAMKGSGQPKDNTGNASGPGTAQINTGNPPTTGMSASAMTGAPVLRRPTRVGRVNVWKRSNRTDDNANAQWADTAPQIADAVSLSAAVYHVLVLRADGTVAALGKKGPSVEAKVPTGLDRVVAVAAGNRFDIALREDGSTVVWSGAGVHPSEGVRPAVAVYAGPLWAVARHADGSLTRLPTSNIGNANGFGDTPPGLGAVSDVAIALEATVALLPDGALSGWGGGGRGGNLATIPSGKGAGVVSVAANNVEAAALQRDGELVVWGVDPASPTTFNPTRFPGADRVVRANPSGAFAVHFPGDRWLFSNASTGLPVDAGTLEPQVNGCFDLAITMGYCVGIKP
ncbi:serine/threonine protein kinase [Roseimicrobium gellanilyticum]|uniref:Serine/threonine protein kinase n=1 Tax=Roseimicrobium gellanilyticum TaxID=748857 RepID=A0A366HVE5_9BACT|nr:serine/threonine-protein kinase [Roseimicrobium gellanilyticum]RBP47840.1 serine/threonine protein kinase [Roseimicrobium gellanilyticum]